MSRPSKEYWADRAAKLEAHSYEKGEKLAKKLKREYARAAKEIRQKLDSFYGRYADEQGLSYAEAVKKLNSKEAREWKRTLGQYVDEINGMNDGKAKDKLIAELDARSYASQQDRLSSLAGQIDMEIDRLFANTEQQMEMTMTDVLEDGYYRKVFDLQQRAGVISAFGRLSTKMIEDALEYPWSGADFSSRIWENKRALLFHARQTITQGIIQGKSVVAMSKDLSDAMGKSYTVSERLIRTETNHFHNEADKMAYEAAGVEEYEFIATLDNRTSKVCASLDGKHFKLEDAKPGTNYPPMHPHCRSTTIEYDPEDAADWAASGQPMPKNMTYDEWKEEQDIVEEESPRKSSGGKLGVNWPEIQSDTYRARLEKISDNPSVVDAIETRARWMLNNHDGKKTEELYAIDLETGREVARIVGQNNDYGVKRTALFDRKTKEAIKENIKLLLMHNHPRGLPPSIGDINILLEMGKTVGVTIGHDGSIYLYSGPKKHIQETDFVIAMRHYKDYTETTAMEKALRVLSDQYGFSFERL